MIKITDEVYTYIVNDAQMCIVRARDNMTAARGFLEKDDRPSIRMRAAYAVDAIDKLTAALKEIDDLPALGEEENVN